MFKYLLNPLVVYTDSKEFKMLMETIRTEHANITVIHLLNRTELWPFQLISEIKTVYEQPGYPKYSPNTVIPEYAAAQHAKYAAVADTVRKEIFVNPYYAWLDIGYFREVVQRNIYFVLTKPPGFDSERIAFNLINKLPLNKDPVTIFRNNVVWIGGGLFVGSGKVLLQFEQSYHKAVLYFLDKKLMNTDQQVIYALYSDKGRKALKPDVKLQIYSPKGPGNPWFYLGYQCVKEISKL